MREGRTKRVLPVSLDDNPRHALRFAVPEAETMTLPICELIETYEKILGRTKPGRTELVERNVLESQRLSARHLPLCPAPSQHELLPGDNIDCVACTLEYDVSTWSYACYVLRVQGNAGLITAEVYLCAAPRAAGLLAMPFKAVTHTIRRMGDSSGSSDYRHRNPDSPSKVEHGEAKEKGERILHFVENALDVASSQLQERSAQTRVEALRTSHAPTRTTYTKIEETFEDDQGPKGPKKIKRRGDDT